ncbi:MAG: hypothetical protein JWM10_1988 [Myxococcaceae bacterium]|nr:hypothetical protein [Myxococcaceae bacterium]
MSMPVRMAMLAALSLGCERAEVIEPDAGPVPTDLGRADVGAPKLDLGVPPDAGTATSEAGLDAPDDAPAEAGVDAPDDAPAEAGVDAPAEVDAPRDVGPPRTLTCGSAARIEDPAGDTVIVGNEAGGRFTLVLDVPIANVGVIARRPVDLTLNGDFVLGARVVHFVGEGAAASTLYAPRGVALERAGTPAAPFADVNGHATMSCASDCEPGRVPGERGCNSGAQIITYFQRRFGEGRRMTHLQTSTLDGLYIFAGRGGCCLP